MKFTTTILLIAFTYQVCSAQKQVPVFISGTKGYATYRIPAIIALPNQGLLAFCEGRVQGGADFGNIDIVMKRSTDGGKTWSYMQTVVDMDSLQAGNPAPVVDLTDPAFPQGRIFLFYNTGNNHEGEVRKGNGLREVWYKTSANFGETWSEAVNITTSVHHPYQPASNPAYAFTQDWRSYANTPGHALQIAAGKFRGRLFVAANHSEGSPKAKFEDYFSHGYFTDDHGKTFQLSQSLSLPGSNEATAAEISNNGILLNARNQKGDMKARIVARSSDGGNTWDTIFFDHNLPDPVCEGTILNIGKKGGKQILAFCNAADTARRNHLTLRISYDEGLHWTKNILIDEAPENQTNDYTAYSDIVKLNQNRIGILYERNGYGEIVYSSIQWKK